MIKILFISKKSNPLIDLFSGYSKSNIEMHSIDDIDGIKGHYSFEVVIVDESKTQIDPSMIPGCKYLQLTDGVRADIDVEAFNKVGITVLSAAPILAKSVASRTVGMMGVLSDPKGPRGVVENDSIVGYLEDTTAWRRLSELKIGIIGYGTVGRAVAELLTSHSVEVTYTDLRNVQGSNQIRNKIRRASLDQLISRSDVISLHVPHGPTANPLIGKRELSLFSKQSILINTSDKRVICEEGVLTALQTGALGGLGGDFIFSQSYGINQSLIKLPNIVVTSNPNDRSKIEDCKLANYIAHNIKLITAGDEPEGIIKVTQFPKLGDPAFWSSDLTS